MWSAEGDHCRCLNDWSIILRQQHRQVANMRSEIAYAVILRINENPRGRGFPFQINRNPDEFPRPDFFSFAHLFLHGFTDSDP